MNQIPAPLPYYPSPEIFCTSCDSLFGFKVGTSFDSHGAAFKNLIAQGFEASPARIEGTHQEFSLSRAPDSGNNPIEGSDEFDSSGCVFFSYDAQGRLTTIALAFGGEPVGSAFQNQLSAAKIYDFLLSCMGPEVVKLERIKDWAKEFVESNGDEVAYAGAWASLDANQSAFVGFPVPCSTTSTAEFSDAVAVVSRYAPTIEAMLVHTSSGVTALVTVKATQAE